MYIHVKDGNLVFYLRIPSSNTNNKTKQSNMDYNYNTHVHLSSHTMEIVPSDEKNSPYTSKKNVGSVSNLNCKVEVDGEIIRCSHFASLFTLNGINCYRNDRKVKVSKLFSDESSIKRTLPGNFKEVYKNIIENACGRYIIACDKFGYFLRKIASTTVSWEQRFFILESCNHVMSFRVTHKIKEIEGASVHKWVVHFFDPNATNVVSRVEVLSPEEFIDLSRFSLRMFMTKCSYKNYFENNDAQPIENECAISEYSDIRNASFNFSILETLSQDEISGCMIYHMMSSNIASLDIREIVKSRFFSTLSYDTRKEIFFAKSSVGVSALQLVMEQNKSNSIRLYNDFLGELFYDEQLSLLPNIVHTKSPEGVPALFIAMQQGHTECINNFSLLIHRLMNLRYRMPIESFSEVIFDILLANSKNGCSALSMALSKNNTGSVLAFGNLLGNVFILKDVMGAKKLANLIFRLLSYKDDKGMSVLFYAFQEGYADTVRAFGTLMDRLLLMKGNIPGNDMASMIFRLLESRGLGFGVLFFSLCNGYSDIVFAFSELMDRLLVMKGDIHDNDMANMIFKLLMSRHDTGDTGLFIALQEGQADAVIAFGGLVSKFVLLRHSIPEAMFNSMMLDILMATSGDGISGILVSLGKGDINAVTAYSSLLVYAPKEVRKEIFCVKDSKGLPALHAFMAHNSSQSLMAYDHFLQALSHDEKIDLLPILLISKNANGDPALFVAMQEGYEDCVNAYSIFIENQLMTIRDIMPPNDFVDLVLSIVFAKRSDGTSALLIGMNNNRVSAIKAYAVLLDKVLSLLKSVISDNELANIIFRLLKARSSTNIDGLFIALQEGNSGAIVAFGFLLDIFISMKEYTEDVSLANMVFDLLMCKSGDNDIPGLFMAMQEGHHGAVEAFTKLLEKTLIFKNYILTEFFNNMLLDTVISKRSDGISGLFVALKNNFPEVIRSYGSLLSLIPKDELVNVLVASDSYGIPAALLTGGEALDNYLEIISSLPTRTMYALHSRLNSIRRSIRYTSLSNIELDEKYVLLLKKIEELVRSSRQSH